jgi:hypothetical protein
LIRDPGPLYNLGNGVSSRDVPIRENETEGDSPNSGFIARALNQHPVMRFVAASATTMVVAGVLSKMTKAGGLKLIKFAEESAARKGTDHIATRAIETGKQIRKQLDELQGVSRYVEGESDPYSKLVYGENNLTTGYDGVKSERFGFGFLTKEERRLAGNKNSFGDTAVNWQFRDELQQRLVRAGRKLPYELPAFYVGQKAIVDPLFGEREQGQSKVKWYNPVDVITDFTKESVKSVATMILPFEFAGAAASGAKSSLHTLKYAEDNMRGLTPSRQKMHKSFVDVTEVLTEVGHDFANLTDKFLKKGVQTAGAFNSAASEFKNLDEGFVQSWHRMRGGLKAARDQAQRENLTKNQLRKVQFNQLFTNNLSSESNTYSSVFDLLPGLRGTTQSIRTGVNEFKMLGKAYDANKSPMDFKKVMDSLTITHGADAQKRLVESIQKIQSMHSSRLSRLAAGINNLGGGGPGSGNFRKGYFSQGMEADAYKDLLEKQLLRKGLDKKGARHFVNHLDVKQMKPTTHATKIVTIGKGQIFEQGDTPEELTTDFFHQILQRYKGIKGGQDLSSQLTPDAFQDAVEKAKNTFVSKEYQKRLNNKITRAWNKFERDDLHQAAEGILKPKKAQYQDFVGAQTSTKLEYLQRKSAQTLGIKLTDDTGQVLSNDIVLNQLRNRGIDPNNFTDLRAFLIKNKQMTSGVFGSGMNLFGLESMSIDEATERKMFSHLSDGEQKIITQLAGRMAINDPVSGSIGLSKLDGVYKTSRGQVLDFTAIKSAAAHIGDFFGSEFKIPILNFNPVTDLFGYQSLKDMSRRSPIQYVSSRSVQPFLKESDQGAEFYIYNRTKGLKGRLTAFSNDPNSGMLTSRAIEGEYRSIPSNTMDLLSRHTRYGSGEFGSSPEQIRGELRSPFLRRLLGEGGDQAAYERRTEAALRFKERFAFNTEQPNSLFGQISRFRNRASDIENPQVLSRLLSGESVVRRSSGGRQSIRLMQMDNGAVRVVDEAGQIVEDISEATIARSFTNFADQVLSSAGYSQRVMQELERLNPNLFTFRGAGVSEINSPTQLRDFAQRILNTESQIARQLRDAGIDPTPVLSSSSRMSKLLEESDLGSISMMAKKSPTISTKFDELKNEIFRYISQTNQLTSGSGQNQIFIEIQKAVDDLVASGAISAAQRTEAQAAGLGTLFNLSAFKTYTQEQSNIESVRKRIGQAIEFSRSDTKITNLYDPYIKGEFAQISGTMRKRFSPLLSPAKKMFGTAPYQPDELAIDQLGSGQFNTIVPTFGTVFKRNPKAALKNITGINTYSDPESFSLSSVPVSQGVERLNRYFGTLGMQLDVSKFNGPLDLFARGMVGKRVLPMYAAGTAFMTVDRTMGGMVNERDDRGERVYSPLILGAAAEVGVNVHAAAAGLIPGGMTMREKKEQLVEGEVPIRQGRFWPLGNTPFKGGKIMYYRPSWYRKLQGGAMFTDDTYGSPMEKFLFYNDISPLRPLDPYRFERKHYADRPYPVTGEYFSGPFGPLVPIANATIGRVLKPQKMMHEEELSAGLASYAPAGEFGAYDATAYTTPIGMSGFSGGVPGGGPGGFGGSGFGGGGMQGGYNREMASRAGSMFTARNTVRQNLAGINTGYTEMSYGPPKVSKVMNPRIVPAGSPIMSGRSEFQLGEAGYRTQEMLGIYGFGIGNLRQSLGFGQSDFDPQRSVLQSASKAYGTTRAFWDQNLGGLGDIPIGGSEGIGNIEFSEIVRRFIPKERTGVDYINPIKNTMGQQYPFLPGSEYYLNFQTGDPFTKVQEGELRLPGRGYERFNKLHPDQTGRYGLIDQLNILGDVAPYSQQYKRINSQLNKQSLSPEERIKVQEIRQQVEDTTTRKDFQEYEYKGKTPADVGMHPIGYGINRVGEMIAHSDNFVLSKAFGKRSALEDWERSNVYGTTFPQWQNPIESYITPMLQESTQKNPIIASSALAVTGSFFGRTPRAKLFGSLVGATAGAGASIAGNISEFVTGERYIPSKRKEELALEEYSDILTYTKNTRLANMAEQAGDSGAATQFRAAAKRTMYGADVYSGNVSNLAFALPKRKREHFEAFVNAPVEDREKILSTAGRLERRFYEAAWGMNVEKLPDLNEYFTRHELPDENWEGWHPNTSMDQVKIKTGQHMGLDMSQMGYYPQQIKEANLANASYPDFFGSSGASDVRYRLQRLMSGAGVTGTVTPVSTPFGSQNISISAGIG